MAELSYFEVTGTWEPSSSAGVINGVVSFTMLVENNDVLAAPTLDIPAVVVPTVVHSSIDNNVLTPVTLLSNTAALNIEGTLYYRADFTDVYYNEPGEQPVELSLASVTFTASPDTTPINLVDVTPEAGAAAVQVPLPSVIAANITDASTLGRALLTAANQPAAQALLGIPTWPFPMANNYWACVGDSMAARNSLGQGSTLGPGGGNISLPLAYQPFINPTFFNLLPIMTHQRIRRHPAGGMYAVSSSWVISQHDLQLPKVLAMDPLPGACVLTCGAAEMVDNTAYDFATNKALVRSMVAQLLAAGVMPILWTVPPINSTGFPVSVPDINVRLNQWNVFIRMTAAEWGFPLIDAHSALAQVDGTHLPGTTPDLLHPNGPGHVLVSEQALADGLANWFPPNSLVNTARTTDDLTTLWNDGTINLGLFTTDTDSNGIADGLTATGTASHSLVTPDPADQLLGKWQRLTVAAGNTASLQGPITSGWSAGDIVALSCRFRTQNMADSGAVYSVALISVAPGGFTIPVGTVINPVWNGVSNWGGGATTAPDLDDGELYIEFEIDAAFTTLAFYSWIQSVVSGTATLDVGEVTVRNLSTGEFIA